MDTATIPQNEDCPSQGILSPEELCVHWQGHRRVTRRLIEAFPEKKLFQYSIGGMRPCSELVMEMVTLSALGIHGLTTSNWNMTETPSEVHSLVHAHKPRGDTTFMG